MQWFLYLMGMLSVYSFNRRGNVKTIAAAQGKKDIVNLCSTLKSVACHRLSTPFPKYFSYFFTFLSGFFETPACPRFTAFPSEHFVGLLTFLYSRDILISQYSILSLFCINSSQNSCQHLL